MELLRLHRLFGSLGRYWRGGGPTPFGKLQVGVINIDGGGNDEELDDDDRLGRCVEVSSAHVVIRMSRSSPIFRFYQLAECRQEVPLMPGLKDQLEKRVGLKKKSQWFIQ